MQLYQRIKLEDLSLVGDPIPKPEEYAGLDQETLNDMSVLGSAYDLGEYGYGYWPVTEEPQTFDPRKKMYGAWAVLNPDNVTKTVTGSRLVIDRPDPQPIQLSKIDFWRLFTNVEKGKYEGLRKQVAELTFAELSLIENIGFLQLAVIFREFDLLNEFIELDNAETIQGLYILQQSGMLTEDRLVQVMAGTPPA